jgi:hypothetical protein
MNGYRGGRLARFGVFCLYAALALRVGCVLVNRRDA